MSAMMAGGPVSGSALLVTHDIIRAGRMAHALSSAGLVVTLAFDAQHALACLRDVPTQVVLADLGALGPHPRSELRAMHRLTPAPLLALVDHRHVALEAVFTAGAAAAVPIDVDAQELVAQVQALLGLREGSPAGLVAGVAAWGPIVLDHGHRRVLVHDQEVRVTPIQSRLLSILIAAGGNVVTHTTLYRLLWRCGIDDDGQRLAAHIHRLRERLGGSGCAGALIRNVRSVGYRILEPAEVPDLCPHLADDDAQRPASRRTDAEPAQLIVLPELADLPAAQ
ncbi:MAG: winged-helix domain-containing protein [Nitriliruptoraceae bacterium]